MFRVWFGKVLQNSAYTSWDVRSWVIVLRKAMMQELASEVRISRRRIEAFALMPFPVRLWSLGVSGSYLKDNYLLLCG